MIEQRYLMTGYDLIDELERVINLILAYPRGLSILLGTVEAPTSGEIVRAFPPRQIDNMGIRGNAIPEAERNAMAASRIDEIIKEAGGWEHITSAISDWSQEHEDEWRLMVDHISGVRKNRRWISGSALERLAYKYQTTKERICKMRRHFAGMLADYILFKPIEDKAV